jgi:BirA family biotin operon repressor/biotin-[acetyl-CoA-carboxylase] ligase
LARKGCPPYTVVIAERQSEGRGRLGRNWVSEEGGLFFTVVLRPRLAPAHSGRLNLAVATVLAKTLRALYDVPAAVKWPNDILVDEKKLVGILSEMEAESDQVTFVNIGVGINVNNPPPPATTPAVSLKQLLGRRVMRKALLSAFLDNLQNYLASEDLSRVVNQWKQYTVTLGRQVKVATQNEIYEGRAIDVADDGALVLQMADGSHQNVIYGDCFHQP